MPADPEEIRRLGRNLIIGAPAAMPRGDTPSMQTETLPARIVLEICGTGERLKTEECEGSFTLYYTTKQNGTGLRLAIAPSLVGDHGGTIGVRNAEGIGSAFQVEVPRHGRHE